MQFVRAMQLPSAPFHTTHAACSGAMSFQRERPPSADNSINTPAPTICARNFWASACA
jgi:hypothetical protein